MFYVRTYYEHFTEFNNKDVKYVYPVLYLLVKTVVDTVPTAAVGETLSYVCPGEDGYVPSKQ